MDIVLLLWDMRYHICRRIKEKKLKVGHAGTLDPVAAG